ncbi:MAG: BatA domain-containing protein [Pirellulales bacterium]|nr:BatA domain-containing protein [Pirellulales bacterium]
MDFVNPALLAGVALAAVPIILHLVLKQKPRHLEFPALRFVKKRREANQRRLRWRQLLLLAARVAAICLLALALARPSLKMSGGIAGREAPVAAVMIFDTSPRMQYRRDNRTRLEEARQQALWLLSQLPEGSQVAVVDGTTGTAVYQVDLGSAKQRVERLDTHPTTRPLAELMDEGLRLLTESDKDRKELYVFTDLARNAWPQDDRKPWAERMESLGDAGFYLIDVGVQEPQNFALGEIRLSSDTIARHSTARVTTSVSLEGSAGERGVELYVLDVDGKPQKRSQEVVQLADGDSREVEFPLSGLAEGTHQGFVRIVGEDGLAIDDARYFTIEALPAWNVLIAASPPVDLHSLYLAEALAPESFRRNGTARFNCTTIASDQLAEQDFKRYAAICLVDPPSLSADAWQKLAIYAAEGGGVAIFLGRNAAASAGFNEGAAQDLLPGKLAKVVDRETHFLPDEQFVHPLWSKFRDVSGIPWSQFPVHHYWELGPLVADASVLARYADGGAALVERPVGRGRVLVMTTPISDPPTADAWNQLPSGIDAWPFVMLANESTLYLVGSHAARLNYVSGQTVVIPVARRGLASAVLSTPQGDEFRQSIDPEREAVIITATATPGQYQIRAGGDEEGMSTGFSVNLPATTTSLRRMDDAELAVTFGESGFQLVRDREEIDRQLSAGRVGRELYGWLMGLVAVVLAAEFWLSNRFYRPVASETEPAK